jgi:hypothetical protein
MPSSPTSCAPNVAPGKRSLLKAGRKRVGDQQQVEECRSAVSMTEQCHAPLPAHTEYAGDRHHPRMRSRPLQHRPKPVRTDPLQAGPNHHSHGVTQSLRAPEDRLLVPAEPSSNWSVGTAMTKIMKTAKLIRRFSSHMPLFLHQRRRQSHSSATRWIPFMASFCVSTCYSGQATKRAERVAGTPSQKQNSIQKGFQSSLARDDSACFCPF